MKSISFKRIVLTFCFLLVPLIVTVPSVITGIKNQPITRGDIGTPYYIQLASLKTGCPEYILLGIANAESDFTPTAIGDGGKSLGMFQINEDYRKQRILLAGFEYDPFNVYEAAVVAGLIYNDNLQAFNGDERNAIAAYKQGVYGVIKNGRIEWYVDKVLKFKQRGSK